jgi:hypothetical protein
MMQEKLGLIDNRASLVTVDGEGTSQQQAVPEGSEQQVTTNLVAMNESGAQNGRDSDDDETLPPLHFRFKPIHPILYILFLLALNLLIPCLLFYLLSKSGSE